MLFCTENSEPLELISPVVRRTDFGNHWRKVCVFVCVCVCEVRERNLKDGKFTGARACDGSFCRENETL